MPAKRILKYIISLILFSIASTAAYAQKKDSLNMPLFRDISIEGDISSVYTLIVENSAYKEFSLAARMNLKGKYFPSIEAGYAYANELTPSNIVFETASPFFKAGIATNLLKNANKSGFQNLFLIGLHAGISNFDYNIQDIYIEDTYWSLENTFDKHFSSTRTWWEVSAGMRVMLNEYIYSGWTIRNRHLFGNEEPGSFKPLYIPGYGINDSKNWKFNYLIGIRF